MRTLDEIVGAARLNESLSMKEARYAITAFDVLLAQLRLEHDAQRLKEWMTAATLPPDEYIGEGNDPEEPHAIAWYQEMRAVGAELQTADKVCTLCGRTGHVAASCPKADEYLLDD